jgi:hypothetical protein
MMDRSTKKFLDYLDEASDILDDILDGVSDPSEQFDQLDRLMREVRKFIRRRLRKAVRSGSLSKVARWLAIAKLAIDQLRLLISMSAL